MATNQSRSRSANLRRFGIRSLMLVTVLAAIDIVGWIARWRWAVRGDGDTFGYMKANTAFCFLLSGISILLLSTASAGRFARAVSRTLSLAVFILGALTASEYLVNVDFHIDEAIFKDSWGIFYQGRMAPLTTLGFVLTSIAALIYHSRSRLRQQVAQFLVLIVFLSSLLGLIGYLYSIKALYQVPNSTAVALNTTLLFLVQSLGFLALAPHTPLMSVFESGRSGSIAIVRSLSAIIIAIIVTGYLTLSMVRQAHVEHELSIVLFAVLTLASSSVVLWLNARRLDRIDLERENAFEALEQKQADLDRAQKIASLGSFVSEPERGQIVVSNEMAALLGIWPKTELTFDELIERTRPDDREMIRKMMRETVRTRAPFHFFHRVSLERGIERVLEVQGEVVVSEHDGSAKWIGTALDVTEKQLAHDAVRAQEERLRSFVEQSPFAVAMLDRDMRYLFVSRRWIADYHLEDRELRGASHYEVFPEIDEKRKAIHRRCLAGATERSEGEKLLRPDGSLTWIRWEVKPWNDVHGEIGGLIIFSEDVSAQMHVREALKESEEKYRATFDRAGVGIAHVGIDGRWLNFNERLCEIVGYSRNELLQKTFQDITYLDDLAEDLAMAQRLLSGELSSYSMEKRYIQKSGALIWANLTGSLVRDSSGDPKYFIAVVEDISEKVANRQALQKLNTELEHRVLERTEYLQALQEVSAIANEGNDPERVIRQGFSRICSLGDWSLGHFFYASGDEKKELISSSIWHFREDRALFRQFVEETEATRLSKGEGFVGGVFASGELGYITDFSDDTPFLRHAAAQAVGIRSAFAFPVRMGKETIGVAEFYSRRPMSPSNLLREVADQIGIQIGHVFARKRAEERIRVSEERLRQLIDQAPDGVFVSDRDGNYIDVNPSGAKILGYEPAEIVGKSINDFISKAEFGRLREQFEVMSSTKETLVSEWLMRHHDGRLVQVEVSARMLTDGRVQAFVRDITEKKKLERTIREKALELSRSNADLEQFAYVASHDLKEPLRMISNYIDLLGEKLSPSFDEQTTKYMGYVREGASRMQSLISDLLLYSRAGHGEFEKKECDLRDIVDESIENLKAQISETQADVRVGALPRLPVNRSMLMQLFQNLIGNAIKFHREAVPIVEVCAHRSGGEWIVSVQDNGMGIDPKYFGRIFVLFQRLHSRAKYPGTGIGLALCKKIVERHGGRIWVESVEGQGSKFSFSIPDEGALSLEAESGAYRKGQYDGKIETRRKIA